jgi:hypothetical protein
MQFFFFWRVRNGRQLLCRSAGTRLLTSWARGDGEPELISAQAALILRAGSFAPQTLL